MCQKYNYIITSLILKVSRQILLCTIELEFMFLIILLRGVKYFLIFFNIFWTDLIPWQFLARLYGVLENLGRQ